MTPIMKNNPVLQMNLVCRTCLNESNNMKPIFIDDGNDVYKMLQSCSGLNVHEIDGFPTNICLGCLNKVHISYEFRQQCENSHNALVNFMRIKMNGEFDCEIENRSQGEATQTSAKLVNDLEIYKCSLCPNQYTMLAQLQEHFMSDHPHETYETKLDDANLIMINGNASETSESNSSPCMNDIKMECIENESALNFKENFGGEISVNESNSSFAEEILIYNEDPISEGINDEPFVYRKTKSSGNIYNDDYSTSTLCNLTFEKKSSCYEQTESQHNKVMLEESDQCDTKFSRLKEVQRYQVNYLNVKSYPCAQCNKCFSRSENRNRHMRQHSVIKTIKPYKCDKCETSFTRSDNLRRHHENRHGKQNIKPAPPKTEVCEICQKAFTTPKNLHFHMKVHRTIKEWTCQFCKQNFSSKQDQNDHQKVHAKERPFLCSECGLRFGRNDYLVIHMRRHNGEKPYKCKYCGKGFPRGSDLTVHERYHTGEKKHLCTICGKGFQRAYNLLVHTRVHTGERPYKCPHCDKSFTQGNDLKAHVRRHTGELFKCDICSDGFIHGYHLTQHKRNQHGIDKKSHIRRVEKFNTPLAGSSTKVLANLQNLND